MRQKFLVVAFFILLSGINFFTSAQSTEIGITPKFAGGEVSAVESGKIVLQTKDGMINVMISDKTAFKKVSPESPKLSTAVEAAFSEIGIGDKLLVTGEVAADKKSIPAKNVYLMSKSAIAEKQAKESEQWRTRGVSGRVTSLSFDKNEITIAVRNMTGESNIVITPKENSVIKRYAPNSIKYDEAKPSNIKEIFIGDVVRAMGDKSADGATLQAEQLISGAFQTIGGKVKSIDAAKNEIIIEDIKTKKDVIVSIGDSSTLKKFPVDIAQRIAMRGAGGAGGGFRPPQGNQQNNAVNPPASNTQNQPGAGGGRGMRGGGDINEMFERLPIITVADLKVGDLIAVSSTKTDTATKVTAIRLLAGVEPFLTSPQMSNGEGRGRGGQQGSDLNIPGLDGFDVP